MLISIDQVALVMGSTGEGSIQILLRLINLVGLIINGFGEGSSQNKS
jgi:hypothetical protein